MTMQKEFEEFFLAVNPGEINPGQKKDIEMAFFAGAFVMGRLSMVAVEGNNQEISETKVYELYKEVQQKVKSYRSKK